MAEPERRHRPILIAGPTASGKSALALAFAELTRGIIINADSMQVYRELRILTARPSDEEEAAAPHRLYGHVASTEAYSVARWLVDMSRILDEARQLGRRPIVVGGTGLYFKALTEGLSPVPPVPGDVRAHWRREAERLGTTALHAALADRDPIMAARLDPADAQRVTRALEVIEATGRSLAEWQKAMGPKLIDPDHALKIAIQPPRHVVHARCDLRFEQMMASGALDEVHRLMQLGLDPVLPAMRAIGVAPLAAYLSGRISRPEAIALGQTETRQYVKRQETWLKRNMIAWNHIETVVNCNSTIQFMHLIDE